MAGLAVDYIVPIAIGKCVARLRNQSMQLTKQAEQQRRDKERSRIEVTADGNEAYHVLMSKNVGAFIGARLDGHLKPVDNNQTRVTASTRISRFTKLWAVLIGGMLVSLLLIIARSTLSSRGVVGIVLMLVIGFEPLIEAYLLKRELVRLLQNGLLPVEGEP